MYDNFFSIQINRQIDHHHIFLNDCFSVYNIRDSSYYIIHLRYIYYQFFSSFFIIFIKELEEEQCLKIIYLEKRHQMIQIFPIAKYISQIVKNYKEPGNVFFYIISTSMKNINTMKFPFMYIHPCHILIHSHSHLAPK